MLHHLSNQRCSHLEQPLALPHRVKQWHLSGEGHEEPVALFEASASHAQHWKYQRIVELWNFIEGKPSAWPWWSERNVHVVVSEAHVPSFLERMCALLVDNLCVV